MSRVSVIVTTAFLVSCLIIAPQTVKATITVIDPSSADNYIDQIAPNTVGASGIATGFYGGSGNRRHGLVKFDLSTIPAGAIINSATLTLYSASLAGSSTGKTLIAYRVTQDWTEDQVTWNNAKSGSPWSTPGGDWTTEGSASATVPPSLISVTWTVTDIVKTWISEGKDNFGFILVPGTMTEPDMLGFFNRESASKTPLLTIDWNPAPKPPPTVEPKPVGGLVTPTNKLAILTPYIALAGLIIAVSTVIIKKRK